MKAKKPLKDQYGGGDKSFVFKELSCYKDVESFENFLTSQERQSALMLIINRVRAQEGICYFSYLSLLSFYFYPIYKCV